jgi:arylsulfatase A-like enzyme
MREGSCSVTEKTTDATMKISFVSIYAFVLIGMLGCAEEIHPASDARPARNTQYNNIVWITLDTTRADHLGCYGYFRPTSPNIDKLADKSILFENCVAPMATTLPSHVSTLTGTYPIENGVLANRDAGGKSFVPSEQLRGIAAHLQDEGYVTAAFVSATPLKRWSGIHQGFDHFDEPATGQKQRRAEETNRRAMDWLSNADAAPFFLWVHYFDPHSPYDAPGSFGDTFVTDQDLEDYLSERAISEESTTYKGATIITRESINGYDGEIAYTDHHIGRLLDHLKAKGLWDNTAVTLLADHGEGIGQHNRPRHGEVWNEQLRVPLLIRVPGVAAQRVTTPVSSIDVFPTLLGLMDEPKLEEYLAHASGADALAGPTKERFAFSQMSQRLQQFGLEQTYAITTARWKYAATETGQAQLFDRAEDPFELRDVLGEHPKIASDFQKMLHQQLDHQRQRGVALGGGGTALPLSESVVEELKALGYGGAN